MYSSIFRYGILLVRVLLARLACSFRFYYLGCPWFAISSALDFVLIKVFMLSGSFYLLGLNLIILPCLIVIVFRMCVSLSVSVSISFLFIFEFMVILLSSSLAYIFPNLRF